MNRYAELNCNDSEVGIKSLTITKLGSVSITVNATDDTIKEWDAVFTASQTAAEAGSGLWFEVYSPYLTNGFYFVAQTPTVFPSPEMGQNELMTVEIPLTIVEYKGPATAVKPAAATA